MIQKIESIGISDDVERSVQSIGISNDKEKSTPAHQGRFRQSFRVYDAAMQLFVSMLVMPVLQNT